MSAPVRMAYADPPYLGCCGLYGHFHGDDGRCWDDVETHRALVERLVSEFPAGWALSLSVPSLWTILPMCPAGVRVGAWVKPFASFKPNVPRAWTWEPVIFSGGRERGRDEPTVRDHVSEPITLKRGLTGAKPRRFCFWVFDFLGLEPGDEFVDVFPGTGGVSAAWRDYCDVRAGRMTQGGLFAPAGSGDAA